MVKRGKKGSYSGGTAGKLLRWAVVLVFFAALGVGGWALTGRVDKQLDQATEDLHADLTKEYQHSTLMELNLLWEASAGGAADDQENLDKFLDKSGHTHVSIKPIKTEEGFIVTYHASAWGRERTVTVRWSKAGVKVIDE